MKRRGQIGDILGIFSQWDLLLGGVWEVTVTSRSKNKMRYFGINNFMSRGSFVANDVMQTWNYWTSPRHLNASRLNTWTNIENLDSILNT